MNKKPVDQVAVIFSDGSIVPGVGYSVGDILAALDAARRSVLGVVLRKPEEPPAEEAK